MGYNMKTIMYVILAILMLVSVATATQFVFDDMDFLDTFSLFNVSSITMSGDVSMGANTIIGQGSRNLTDNNSHYCLQGLTSKICVR